MINVILVEDDLYIQRYFIELFGGDKEFNIVTILRDAFEAEAFCSKSIDLVLMDVMTQHKHSGLAAGMRIKEKYPNIKVVIVTSLVDPEVLRKAKAGYADSLWYKDHGNYDILNVIRKTLEGEHIYPDASPSVEMKKIMSADFNPSQIEILRYFIQGYTYKEIAEKLNLSVSGVRWNISDMVEKGGFKNKEELIATAIENKLVVATLEEYQKDV